MSNYLFQVNLFHASWLRVSSSHEILFSQVLCIFDASVISTLTWAANLITLASDMFFPTSAMNCLVTMSFGFTWGIFMPLLFAECYIYCSGPPNSRSFVMLWDLSADSTLYSQKYRNNIPKLEISLSNIFDTTIRCIFCCSILHNAALDAILWRGSWNLQALMKNAS